MGANRSKIETAGTARDFTSNQSDFASSALRNHLGVSTLRTPLNRFALNTVPEGGFISLPASGTMFGAKPVDACKYDPSKVTTTGLRFEKLLCALLAFCAAFAISLATTFLFSHSASAWTLSLEKSGNGTVEQDIISGFSDVVGSETLTINATCPDGYYVYATGNSDNSLLLDGDSDNSASARTSFSVSSATLASPAALLDGYWGLSLNGGSTYFGIDSGNTALRTPSDYSSSSETITVSYGVNATSASSKLSGTYTTADDNPTVTYSLVANETCNSVTFEFDGGSLSEGASATVSGSTADFEANYGRDVTFRTNGFERTSYHFAGWSTEDSDTPDEDPAEGVLHMYYYTSATPSSHGSSLSPYASNVYTSSSGGNVVEIVDGIATIFEDPFHNYHDEGVITLYPMWEINTYDVTIKTTTGISSVSLNGTSCTATSGCVISGLTYGQSYALTATASTGYTFSTWSAGGYGTIANTSVASTTYTVGLGDSVVTPTATANTYTVNFYSNLDLMSYAGHMTSLPYSSVTRKFFKYSNENALIAYLTTKAPESDTATATGYWTHVLLVGSTADSAAYASTAMVTVANTSTCSNNGTITWDNNTYYYIGGCLSLPYDLTSSGGAARKISTEALRISLREAAKLLLDASKTGSVAQSFTYDVAQNLAANTYTRSGYTFKGWSTTPTGSVVYADGENVSNLATTGTVSLYAIWEPTSIMQSFTKSTCSTKCSSGNCTVTDARDSQTYTVRYINGNCWMTSNLLFQETYLYTVTSNISSAATITWGDLTSGNSTDEARLHVGTDSNGDDVVWYNYAGATAMTITGDSNTTEATQSICPYGWTLPTYAQITGILSYVSAFSPQTGGYYYNGSNGGRATGYWPSSTAVDGEKRYLLYYDGTNMRALDNGWRKSANQLRCIRSS